MVRTVLSVIGGLVAWIVIVTIIDIGLRHAIPGYLAAERALAFTLPMKLARLAMSAATSLACGAVVRSIAPWSRWAPWIVGGIVVAVFLPEHIYIGARFPLWYHLAFLVPLAPLVALGARLRGPVRSRIA